MENQAMIGQPCEPVRESEVAQEINHLDAAIVELDTQLSRLFQKLTPVLRHPEPQCSPDGDCKTSQELVPVAGDVRRNRHNIDEFIASVRDVIARLEV